MPVQINEIPPVSLKDAIERIKLGEDINIVTYEVLEEVIKRIAREVWTVQRPENHMFSSVVPGVNDLTESQVRLYKAASTKRLYVMIDGAIESLTFS